MTATWRPDYPNQIQAPQPPLDWNLDGWAETDDFRIVSRWLGARLEQRWMHRDGRLEWRKARRPYVLPRRDIA